MKTFKYLSVLLLSLIMASTAYAKTSIICDDDPVATMIKNFYQKYVFDSPNMEEFTDAVAKKYCTPRLMKQLQDDNDFDDGGYAIWDFRSMNQDGMGKSKVNGVRKVDETTYIVDLLDMGHPATIKLTLVKTASGYLFDKVEEIESLPDFPISAIIGLLSENADPGPNHPLKSLGYKYVGNDSEGRSAIWTWCRNCIATKNGELKQFQKGTSCIISYEMQMGGLPTVYIQVFNTKARDIFINELIAADFKEGTPAPGELKSFSRSVDYTPNEVSLTKTPKGWLFTINPVNWGME